jgi:peptide/nickel transport system substrate-binding protein
VKFTLSKPFAPFLHATAWLFVLNPEQVQANETDGDMGQAWLTSNAAGSGPFKIARWEPGNLYQFDADPNYWRGWEGEHVAGYVHQVSQESATKRLALQNGDAQFADWLSPQDKSLLERMPDIVVPKEPSITTYTVKMNNQTGPTADVNVRRAISYAFDYEAMLDVMSGFATRIAGPLSPSLQGALQTPFYETDLEKAKAELAKSEEYADGFDIEFVYVTGLEEERQTGQILLDQLKNLNINVTITGMEWANAVALFANPEQSPAFFPIYSGSDYPDPDAYLWPAFHSSEAGTWMGASHYSNADVDSMLEEARSTTDEARRTELYDAVQKQLVDEAVELYLWSPLEGIPHRAEVQGYQYTPVMGSDPWWYIISLGAS